MNEGTHIKAADGYRMFRRSTTKKVHIFKNDQRLCKVPYKGSPVIPVETCRLYELCGNCKRFGAAYTAIDHVTDASEKVQNACTGDCDHFQFEYEQANEELCKAQTRIEELEERNVKLQEEAFEEVEKLKNTTFEGDLSKEAKAAIAAIKEMDKARYSEYCYAVGTEGCLGGDKWWLREPILHETMLTKAGPLETLKRMEQLKRYGRSQAFLLVPIDVKTIMEA